MHFRTFNCDIPAPSPQKELTVDNLCFHKKQTSIWSLRSGLKQLQALSSEAEGSGFARIQQDHRGSGVVLDQGGESTKASANGKQTQRGPNPAPRGGLGNLDERNNENDNVNKESSSTCVSLRPVLCGTCGHVSRWAYQEHGSSADLPFLPLNKSAKFTSHSFVEVQTLSTLCTGISARRSSYVGPVMFSSCYS